MRPLDDITVIEIAGWMAAPTAGAIFADLGADVIKVEPLTGDTLRGTMRSPKRDSGKPDLDYAFQASNRGKRSVAVAINEPAGADLVKEMSRSAQVVLTNLLPHRQTRYGLEPADFFAVNPTLVHASLTGYGRAGDEVGRPGFDQTAFWGRAGAIDFMTVPGIEAPQPPNAQGDHATGLALSAAVLAALRLVDRTGEGQVVDVSLYGTGVWTVATELSTTLVDGHQPRKRGRREALNALNSRYECGDGRWVILTMPSPRSWAPFCAAIGREDLAVDERFAEPKGRYQNMADLVGILDEVFATKPLAEWGRILDDAKLIWGPGQRLSDVAADPQAEAMGLFPTVPHPEGGFRTVANPIQIDGVDTQPRRPAPALADHTVEVLSAMGVDDAEIGRLAADGIVGIG